MTKTPAALRANRAPATSPYRHPARLGSTGALSLVIAFCVLHGPTAQAAIRCATQKGAAPTPSSPAGSRGGQQPARGQAPRVPRPEDVVADWEAGGKRVGLSRYELHLELANHQRRRDAGVEALAFLTESALVRAEAEAQQAMPSRAKARAAREQLEAQLKAAGRRLEDEPAFRNMTTQELEDYLAIGLAQQEMTRRAAGLAEGEQPDADLVALWMTEVRGRHTVVTEAAQLPAGVVATVDDKEIGLLDLGRVLGRTQGLEEKRRFLRQIILRRLLADAAEKVGLHITDAQLDRALKDRRAAVESNPAAKGIPYGELLRSVGHTEESLRQDPAFLANLQRQLLVELHHSDASLRKRIAAEPEEIRQRFGARRQLRVLFLRASDEKNPLVPRTFADTLEVAETLRKAILDGSAPMPEVALRFSEHLPTKRNRGDAGWVHRANRALPEEVLASGWELAIHQLSEPIRTDKGIWLVRTLEVEPPATEAVLLDRMRHQLELEYAKDLLNNAAIEYHLP